MTKGILIVEDEPNLGQTLLEYLQSHGHRCHLATSVSSAKNLFNDQPPAIVLMDIGLPDGNGIELAKDLRGLRKDFVLLFLSALNDPETRVEGLELGADDYITKPFALKELKLRLERILETHKQFDEAISIGSLKIDFKSYELTDAMGAVIPLAQKECAILKLLYQNIEHVVTRAEILAQIWGEDRYPSERTIDNYIVKLRRWAETDLEHRLQILNIRGVGYKLTIQTKE